MEIINSNEPIGAEIDCGLHGVHPDRYRAMVRKIGENDWQFVKYLFKTNAEETGRRGTLKELVSHLNLRYGTKDIAED